MLLLLCSCCATVGLNGKGIIEINWPGWTCWHAPCHALLWMTWASAYFAAPVAPPGYSSSLHGPSSLWPPAGSADISTNRKKKMCISWFMLIDVRSVLIWDIPLTLSVCVSDQPTWYTPCALIAEAREREDCSTDPWVSLSPFSQPSKWQESL